MEKEHGMPSWVYFFVVILLIILVAIAVGGQDKSPSSTFRSSTSESTLPPRLNDISGFNCKTIVVNENGKAPGVKATLVVSYKDSVLDPIEFDVGFHYGKNFDTDDAEIVAIKACQNLRKKIREEIVREHKERAKNGRNK